MTDQAIDKNAKSYAASRRAVSALFVSTDPQARPLICAICGKKATRRMRRTMVGKCEEHKDTPVPRGKRTIASQEGRANQESAPRRYNNRGELPGYPWTPSVEKEHA